MKIRFLSEMALNTLKEGLGRTYLSCFKEADNHKLLTALKTAIGEEPLKVSNFTLPDDLRLDETVKGGEEIGNIRLILENLKSLPPAIACDARLWTGLAIDRFWNYTKVRWEFSANNLDGKVNDHFLFRGQSKKSYTRQSIARLWWIGHLTYDESKSNPYEITTFTLKDTAYVVDLLERNFSSNPAIFREFVEAVEKTRSEGIIIERPEIRSLCKYLNLLGGVYVLDAFPSRLIYEKIYSEAHKIGRIRT